MFAFYASNVKPAAAGSLPPQSLTAATGAPTSYVSGAALLAAGYGIGAFVQTGAVPTGSAVFKLSEANDSGGTGVADVTGGDIATLGAQAQGQADIPRRLINPAKYYGIRCTVTGTAVLVAGQLRILGPQNAP